jgi:hypothetical protein
MMPSLPWHAIKIPLLILLAVVLVAGGGVWWSSGKLREAKTAQAQQVLANRSAEQTLQRSNTEKQLIQQYRGAYQTLVARGFIGAENRLAWLEAVQQANRDARLYGLDYSLEPRAPVSISGMLMPSTPSTKTSLLGQTEMKLRMPILVEDDLTRFFDALQQRTPSLFRIRACQISRAVETAPQPLNRPELEVECELLWFTVASTGGPAS